MSLPEGRYYTPIVYNISGWLLVSGLAITILMWTNVIGPFRFWALQGEEASRAVGLWIPESPGVRIQPETTRRLVAWTNALPEDVPILADWRLDHLIEQNVGVIAVPNAEALSPAQAARLWAYMADGGGLLLVGSVGVLDPAGEWLGFALMERLLRVDDVISLGAESGPGLTTGKRGPLVSSLQDAELLRLAPEPGAPALIDPRAELVWLGPDESPSGAASHRLEVGAGRLVWLGAGPESLWDATIEDWHPATRLLGSTLAWLRRQPTLEVRSGSQPASSTATSTADESSERTPPVTAAYDRVGPNRLLLRVTNPGEADATGAVVRVYLNVPVTDAQVGGTTVLQAIPNLILRPGAEHIDLLIPDLAAGRSTAYTLDFTPRSGGA